MTDVKLYEIQMSTHGRALVPYDLSEPTKIEEALSRGVSRSRGVSLRIVPPVGGSDVSLWKKGADEYKVTVTKLPAGPTEVFHHTTLAGALDDVRELVKAAEELEG